MPAASKNYGNIPAGLPWSIPFSALFSSSLASLRNSSLVPPLEAFRLNRAFPSMVLGPVDFSQGRHCWISAACRARRSGV
jgi:hypothetical protein